ncbi:hypothetical protein [Ekhidna sp.]|uniref:hypothetical protein n=1 Tax=Ekhidna sp. TaxID=2608089 RepID=UPI003296C65F
MIRLTTIKIFAVLLIALTGCQKFKPSEVTIPEYPDYSALMVEQVEFLRNSGARKEVWLDGKSEVRVLNMDSTTWSEELAFLKEVNPNQPEYVGAFEKSGDEFSQTLTLVAGENGALKRTTFSKSDIGYQKINATFHEDKDVYIHHREIELNFQNGLLRSLQIDGYQKMMFKDTVRFRIQISVN